MNDKLNVIYPEYIEEQLQINLEKDNLSAIMGKQHEQINKTTQDK